MIAINNIRSVLADWLVGMIFAAVEFSAGFRLTFERSGDAADKPQVLYLDTKAMTYIGKLEQWENFVQSLPFKARRTENDEPAIAYRLMLLLGAEVSNVELASDGTLTIETTDGESITVVGRDDVWEESWSLAEPANVAGEESTPRFVICDSEGGVFTCFTPFTSRSENG